MILERFSLEGGFLVIGPLHAVLNELEGNIFLGLRSMERLIFSWSQNYPFDHNHFVQKVGGWFGHTLLNKFISILVCFMTFFFLKLE